MVRSAIPGGRGVWLTALVLVVARPLRAERQAGWLEVTHGAGSEVCPDETRVLAALTRLFPDSDLARTDRLERSATKVSVAVRRVAEGHEALVTVQGRNASERRIADHDEACRGLADALAVTLVMLEETREAEAPDEPKSEASVVSPKPPNSEPPKPATPNTLTRERRPFEGVPHTRDRDAGARPVLVGLLVEASVRGGLGILGGTSLGGELGVGAWLRSGFGARARLFRAAAFPQSVAPGKVNVDLWAGLFAGCYRVGPPKRWHLEPCAEVGWGRQRAEATGLVAVNRPAAVRPWLVAGPSLGLTLPLAGTLAATARAGLFVRIHEQRYLVDGKLVQHQAPVGAFGALGLASEWSIGSGE